MSFRVVIPARHASTRLPGKPLLDIAGKPMVQHVYERAQASGADAVIVATDDARIEAAVQGFGGRACLTSAEHRSGTDRLAEVVAQMGWGEDDIIVNLQGDEPLMPAAVIRQVATNLSQHPRASMATLCERITSAAQLFDPNIVKVVSDAEGYALYFSRAPIPWDRDAFAQNREVLPPHSSHWRHIGLYAYRAGFLREYMGWTACALEETEALEQLRVLWRGHRIHIAEALAPTHAGVDTPADLERVRTVLGAGVTAGG